LTLGLSIALWEGESPIIPSANRRVIALRVMWLYRWK
jgi:hypothetical protein